MVPFAAGPIKHLFTISRSEGFSSAASTRSLSFSCLLTCASVEWEPGDSCTQQHTQDRSTNLSAAVSKFVPLPTDWSRLMKRQMHSCMQFGNASLCSHNSCHMMCINTSYTPDTDPTAPLCCRPVHKSNNLHLLPLLTKMSTLNRGGKLLSSFVRMHSPIRVAMLQCSTVGVNITLHSSSSISKMMLLSCTWVPDPQHSTAQQSAVQSVGNGGCCCSLHSTYGSWHRLLRYSIPTNTPDCASIAPQETDKGSLTGEHKSTQETALTVRVLCSRPQ